MRPRDPESVYLDSNTLICIVKAESGHEVLTEVLRLGEIRKVTLFISALSMVEVRGWRRNEAYPVDEDARVLAMLDAPQFVPVEFGRAVALRARAYTHRYGLANYDAIHLASAVQAQVDVLMTFDRGFPRGQRVDGVWIDEPYQPGDDVFPGM